MCCCLRTVAADHRRRDISIGDIQIPVGDFDVTDQVANLDFKLGDRNVFVQAGQNHRNPVDHGTTVSHQRMLNLCFDERGPVARDLAVGRNKCPQRLIVSGVDGLLSQGCHATRRKTFADSRLLSSVEALIERIAERSPSPYSSSRVAGAISRPRINERAGLGIELGQRVFHTTDLIGSQHATR